MSLPAVKTAMDINRPRELHVAAAVTVAGPEGILLNGNIDHLARAAYKK